MDNTAPVAPADSTIPHVLVYGYRPEELITVASKRLDKGAMTLEFCFPPYTRSREALGHVSAVQITAAILEGGYAIIEDAIASGMFPPAATSDWFYSTLRDWIALRMNILFRRALKAGELASLDFRILDVGTQRLRRRKFSASFEFDGFCSGETMWIIDPPPGLIL